MDIFVHLRTHSDYSLLESSIKISSIVDLCVRNNMPAVAVTDSGNLFGSLEFSEYSIKAGVQPIIGCSINVYTPKNVIGNVVLLVKNNQGYKNLLNIINNSLKDDKNGELRTVDLENILRLSEGLIILTGWVNGLLLNSLKNNDYETIELLIKKFKDNIYIEIQRHGIEDENEIEKLLIDISYKRNLPLVATNDVFFAVEKDFEAHDVLYCIVGGNYLVQEDRKKLTSEHYFKSSSSMVSLFSDIPEAIKNSVQIAKRCSFILETRDPILPNFKCHKGSNESEELAIQSRVGLNKRIDKLNFSLETKKKYYERLDYELKVIISMNYSGYFLIVSDFIIWSKNNCVPVGPGRGSGVGSLVAWALQITDLDPIKFGLIFERFLNPERISMPDLDIDFCQEKRSKVIEYIKNKYGYVAHIITFGKLQARAVLRDVGRVMQVPYSQVDKICKMIPYNPIRQVTLSEAISMDKNLQKERDDNKIIAKLLEISLKLEGLYRHASIHAAGIVISDRKLDEIIPIYYDKALSLPVTQYSMKYVEKSGLVKFDFLGLRTLTVIDQVCNLINQSGINVNINNIPLNDRKTYELLSDGNSIGVFQLESSGMREFIKKLKPDTIEDIMALISLYRPGPIDNISIYISRKHGLEEPDYIHPLLEDVLKETFGVIIYQEQVMEIARVLAGYSLGNADLLRRAMGKKIKSEMDEQREIFVNGCIANGINKDKSSYIFDLVAKFAGYGFNKSHAAAYSLISFQTAYLKANYTLEFFTASMNLDINDKDKLSLLSQQARINGIKILPPSINYSQELFTIEKGSIRYSISALKNVGQSVAKDIVFNRKKSIQYNTIWDFINNIEYKSLNKKAFESIIKSGMFDEIHSNRKQLFDCLDLLLNTIDNAIKDKKYSQNNLFKNFSDNNLIKTDDWNKNDKLKWEFDSLGFYLTNHPINEYKSVLYSLNIQFLGNINLSNTKFVKIAGIISSVKIRSTNRGKFAIVNISDPYNISEIIFYDRNVIENNRLLFNSGVFIISDVEHISNDNVARLIGRNIYNFDEKFSQLMKEIIIDVGDCNDKAIVKHFTEIFNTKGQTKIFIKILLDKKDKKILLPDSYLINSEIITRILDLKLIKSIRINGNKI